MADRDEVLERVGAAGRRMSDAAVLYHGVLSDRLGLGPSDWKVLGLVQSGGTVTAGEVVRRSGLKPASVTGVLDRLEKRGYVRRVRDEQDRRRVVVEITPGLVDGGRELFAGLMRRLGELYEEYSDEELELIAGFMEEAAERQVKATADLEAGADQDR
ncbi:MarR family transcriptional regulator [Nocardiopsis sp. RSe5-2]|uniref:MarR family transcriptional regulator n=1 Tax=Nocardiopsis endophytica TaxID=3018445 RepID=A0ABT4U2D4_9ACTN|nr:MarR family transcriptional regulator [Nocardiopsis endophytica]MDA2811108.1 MarR family transcriptional regulator [Nocardiopsis endophytica]